MTAESTRAYFRVGYPLAERPRLILGDAIHQVLDCSEGGFRFHSAGFPALEVGSTIEGRIRFRRGAQVTVQGRVVWTQKGQVAVILTESRIPLSIIYDEQRYLRKHYPMWY